MLVLLKCCFTLEFFFPWNSLLPKTGDKDLGEGKGSGTPACSLKEVWVWSGVSGQRSLWSCDLNWTNPNFLSSSPSDEPPPPEEPQQLPLVLFLYIMPSSDNFFIHGVQLGGLREGRMPHGDNPCCISCHWSFTLCGGPSTLPQDLVSCWLGTLCGSPFLQERQGRLWPPYV